MKIIEIVRSDIPVLFAAYFLREKGYEVVVTEYDKRCQELISGII